MQYLDFYDVFTKDFFLGHYDSYRKSESVFVAQDGELSWLVFDVLSELGIVATVVTAEDLKNKKVDNGTLVLTHTDPDILSSWLLRCASLLNMTVLAPITEYHSSKNPLFLISIPKSGTHLIYEMAKYLGYSTGVEFVGEPSPKTWYCVEYSNSHTVAKDFFVDTVRRSTFGNRHHSFMRSPAIFIYRHPLDVLVSEAHYYHKDGKTAFAGWFDGMDFEERVEKLLDDHWLLGSLADRIGGFAPWLRFPNVIPVSFEELIGSAGGGDDAAQLMVIWSIMLKLQTSGNPADIALKIFNPNSPTFRSAKIGGFVEQLSEPIIKKFLSENSKLIDEFGYDKDGTAGLPNRVDEFLNRGIKRSKSDFSKMPLTVKSGFLSCNLTLYDGYYYALPSSAGEIHIEKMSDELLGSAPRAKTLEALQNLLILGFEKKSKYEHSLACFGDKLAGRACGNEDFFWLKKDDFGLIAEYKGYNLVSFQNSILAIKQSIGEVDLSDTDVDSLVAKHGSENIIQASDEIQTYRLIDFQISLDETKQKIFEMEAISRQREEELKILSIELAEAKKDIAQASRGLIQKITDFFSRK